MPFIFPGRGLHSHFGKFTGNLISRISLKISLVDISDGYCLFFVDDKFAIGSSVIPKKMLKSKYYYLPCVAISEIQMA